MLQNGKQCLWWFYKTWLTGVTSTGYSCGICKYKAHKSCASNVVVTCKWTTLNTVDEKCISTLNVRKYKRKRFYEIL